MLILIWLACSGGKESVDSGTAAEEPTLSNVQADVFRSCTFSSCHGSTPAGQLDLLPGQSYGELVGVASSEQPTVMRVVAGDPASSYIMLKLQNDPSITSDEMPPGAPLPAGKISLVEAWIAAGAQDN